MSQSFSNIIIHVIFSTKERKPDIDKEIESELHACMTSLFNNLGCYVYKIGGMTDHVHILTTLPRTITTTAMLEDIKRKSSKWIKTKGMKYKDFSWQKGFGAFSVSESQKDLVINYIGNQKEHHKQRSFQDEFQSIPADQPVRHISSYIKLFHLFENFASLNFHLIDEPS